MKVFLLENYPYDYGYCPVSLIAANSANEAYKIYMNSSKKLNWDEDYSINSFKEIKNLNYNEDSCILVDHNEIINKYRED